MFDYACAADGGNQNVTEYCCSGKKKVCWPRLEWLDEMVKKY